jgi:leucine-rich repeat protein SHOC2
VTETELEEIIEKARVDRTARLEVSHKEITHLPESICNLYYLSELSLQHNKLIALPKNIGNLSNLTKLILIDNELTSIPDSITKLTKLNFLYLSSNRLASLPGKIGNISELKELALNGNKITQLPSSIVNLSSLYYLNIDENPINDLSVLNEIPNLSIVEFGYFGNLDRKYWTKFSEWKPEWFLNEENAEIRRILIQQVGYEKICSELNAVNIDSWREYDLLRIDGAKTMYRGDSHYTETRETLVFLKMTCPSTGHIHILRVPPEMTSAEAAITWVNHGIHPDKFSVQT